MLYSFGIFPASNFVDLVMYQFGREKCEPGHSFGPAARNHFIFHYVIAGKGILYAPDEKGELREHLVGAGGGFLLIPGHITTYIADSKMPWEYIWLEFDGLRVKELLERARFSMDDPVYHAQSPEFREKMFEEMLYISEHEEENPIHLTGHLWLFFDYLLRSATRERYETGSRLREFYMKEALAYIEQNYQKDISVEDIAKNTGLDRSYFGRIFHQELGQSPRNFLISYRMAKAAEMLSLTDDPIAKIGAAVGYENPLHFSRAFRRYYGCPPREWRNRNRVRKVQEDRTD